MVTKDIKLTKKEREWIDDFKATLNRKPKGIEIIVNDGSIRVFVAGSLNKHIGSVHDCFDISNPDVENLELYSFKNKGRLLPYSEGQ